MSLEVKFLAQLVHSPSNLSKLDKEVSIHDFKSKLYYQVYLKIVDFIIYNKVFSFSDLELHFKGNTIILEIIEAMKKEDKINDLDELYKQLIDSAQRERIRKLADTILEKSDDDAVKTKEILNTVESEILNISTNSVIKLDSVLSFGNEIKSSIQDKYDKYLRLGKSVPDISTGFDKLDKYTLGFHRGNTWIIAASSSDGKSQITVQLSDSVAKNNNPILYFSLEDVKENIIYRVLSLRTGIKIHNIRSGQLNSDQVKKLDDMVEILKQENKFFIDDSAVDIGDIISKVKFAKLKHPDLSLVVLDYINLCHDRTQKYGSREQEISFISKKCVALAKSCNVCILILQQLNTNPDDRKQGIPIRLNDLRDSKAPSHDSSVALAISYPNKYTKNQEGEYSKRNAELIIMKNRYGQVGLTIPLINKADVCKFEEV